MSDVGLQLALKAAGGVRPLGRVAGVSHVAVLKWRRIPRDRVLTVAGGLQLEALTLRPDLADWLWVQQSALAEDGVSLVTIADEIDERWHGPSIDEGLLDLWATMASILFVARDKGLAVDRVCRGRRREEEAVRALAMGMALVVGRARPTNIAGVFGVTRQNVTNAAERYIRARDGDDPEDYIGGADTDGRQRVLEGSRLRIAKGADPDMWGMQQRFEAFLAGRTFGQAAAGRRG